MEIVYFSLIRFKILMNTKEQKISLLTDMIAFASVDGKLHEKEFQFLSLIAQELGFTKDETFQLFHVENKPEVIKTEFERIQQFYRLALLMFCDGEIHEKEINKIYEIGIHMALSPFAIKRILKAMQDSPTRMVDPSFILDTFNEQHN